MKNLFPRFDSDGTAANGKYCLYQDALTKCNELALLLVECRDVLPAITLWQALKYNIKPDLDVRIEAAIEPWVVPPGTPGAI